MQSSNQSPRVSSAWLLVRRIRPLSTSRSIVGAYHDSNGSSEKSESSAAVVISGLFNPIFEASHDQRGFLNHTFQTAGREFGNSSGVIIHCVRRCLWQIVRGTV